MAGTDPTQDLLNPTTPKKKPGPPAAMDTGVQGTTAGGAPASALDTGIPPPTTPPVDRGNLGDPRATTARPEDAARTAALQGTLTGQQQATPDAAPQTSGVETVPTPTAGVSPQQGIAQLNQTMMTRFNRVLSPQEVQGIAQAVGPPAGPGGTYTAQQFAQAQDYVSRYSGDINNPFPAAPAAPAPAPPPVDPLTLGPNAPTPQTPVTAEQGMQYINNDAALRLGRPLNQQEVQGLAQIIGPPQGPGGTYTPQQLQAARDWVGRYSGDPTNPFGPLPEGAPGSTSNLANTRLTELLNLDYGEVDPNSQAIQQPLGAFRSAQSRAVDRAKIANALRAQREGTSGGGEEAGLMSLLEEQGQNEASFESNLIVQELAGQRDRLTQAIELATQAGLQNKARELQEELGKLDIELRRYIGQGQLALGAQSLNQNDQQFLESMGYNYARLIAEQNNRAIEAAI